MSYDVGTHISFQKKDSEPEREARRLYIPGTKVFFVKLIPSIQTFTIAAMA